MVDRVESGGAAGEGVGGSGLRAGRKKEESGGRGEKGYEPTMN